jgi:hypothetical protein
VLYVFRVAQMRERLWDVAGWPSRAAGFHTSGMTRTGARLLRLAAMTRLLVLTLEGNWIQTTERNSWFPILRLSSPDASVFDKSWRPSEIERLG